MIFQPRTLDFELSPYTGLTRESWIEAGKYLLEGIFQNIADFRDPVVMPRKETEITYPHLKDPEEAQVIQRRAEVFEGLTRSMFIAAPLIHIEPELTLGGIRIRDYYKSHILRVCTRGDELWIGDYEEQKRVSGSSDPLRTYQQTVETAALVICLWVSREEIWDTYTRAEKDVIAGLLSSYAHGATVPQNWRLFNMLDLAFLHMEGYPIDEEVMLDHAQAILGYYAGDGWYRDGHSFDYYSCWAFNFYGPVWNLWYGYDHAPEIARQFEENSNRLMETYPDFFDRDGFTNMWGRSNIYRNASTSAFDGNLMLRSGSADPGLARRICSGSLLQFLTREDFLYRGVPTLGFYGQFSPLVQGYSCAESPLWMGKAFLCLHLPAEHPFWMARENNGTWEKLGEKEVKVTALDGPGLCFSNHQANGETVLRTGKVVKNAGDRHGMWNYSKLCFDTKFPWEASAGEEPVESQQYVLRNDLDGVCARANVTFWQGESGGVLYRRQFFDYTLSQESHWLQALNLADVAVPYGILRADKMRFFHQYVTLTLGAYGFPDNGTEVLWKSEPLEEWKSEPLEEWKPEPLEEWKLEPMEEDSEKVFSTEISSAGVVPTDTAPRKRAQAVVLKGHDAAGREKQLAMTIYDGWEKLALLHSRGTNPDSERSILVYAEMSRRKRYGYAPYLLISQVLTKESLEDFAEEELFPLKKVEYTDPEGCGGYGPVKLIWKDGREKVIDFAGMEGKLSL